MAVKLRLRRLGRTHSPFYQIVAADSRSPRDGRFIEKLGTYNPLVEFKNVEINHEVALKWLKCGAIPTDTVRSILSHEGILLKLHLYKQKKSEQDIDRVYDQWKAIKLAAQQKKIDAVDKKKREQADQALAHEKRVREARSAKAVAKRNAPKEE